MLKFKVWKNYTKSSLLRFWESPVFSHCTVCWTYSWGFGWIFDQIIRIFSISLLSSRGCNSIDTYSIRKFLYVLKSYDPNSFISSTFDVIRPRCRTKNDRWSWMNFDKIHLHHPTMYFLLFSHYVNQVRQLSGQPYGK